jgi:hypothetical protein
MDERVRYRRIVRRELHASRAVPAMTVAVLLILAVAAIGTVAVLAASGNPGPLTWAKTVAAAGAAAGHSAVLASGCVATGLLLLISALSPGRRARHELLNGRAAVVVDDSVLAAALAREAARAAGLAAGQAVATVHRRRAAVVLTPTSGVPIGADAVAGAVRRMSGAVPLRHPLRVRVTIARSGKVGA